MVVKKKIAGAAPQPPRDRKPTPPGDGGVDDNARSSALADSWLARMDGEKITPRRVGETGVGDGGGDGALAFTSVVAIPSGRGRV